MQWRTSLKNYYCTPRNNSWYNNVHAIVFVNIFSFFVVADDLCALTYVGIINACELHATNSLVNYISGSMTRKTKIKMSK